jgi:hypothetical protein
VSGDLAVPQAVRQAAIARIGGGSTDGSVSRRETYLSSDTIPAGVMPSIRFAAPWKLHENNPQRR